MKKEFTCIVCPVGCALTVYEDGNNIVVEGNGCRRGIDFGIMEYKRPMRMLTTTVKIEGGIHKRLPVISDGEIPKDLLTTCVRVLYGIVVKGPVKRGQIILENICDTNVNIIASRSM